MILMYHHIAPLAEVPKEYDPLEGWEWTHSPEGFERQIVELRRRGYSFIQLADLVDDIRKRGSESPKTAVLTFDDGWIDNFTHAFPILKRHSIPATFFVTTDHIHKGVDDPRKMSVADLKELMRSGMTVGSHTREHQDVTKLASEDAWTRISACKQDLENALGTDVHFFAYPGGAFNSEVVRLTQKAGYKAACSVLGPSRNDKSSLFWLYRDVITESLNTLRDRYRLTSTARGLLSFRVRRRLCQTLSAY
jgi:peptidoglycan/xylan/chitin deacetylase (PgdA/CDA1 family)